MDSILNRRQERRPVRKGSLEIRTVGLIMLGIAVVALVYMGVSGQFESLIDELSKNVNFRSVE